MHSPASSSGASAGSALCTGCQQGLLKRCSGQAVGHISGKSPRPVRVDSGSAGMATAAGPDVPPPTGYQSPFARLMQRFRSTRGRSAVSSQADSPKAVSGATPGPTHLVILANGLFGSPANWSTIVAQLKRKLGPEVLIHASEVNKRTDTYDGIDVCGTRLAKEIDDVIARHPSLTRLSVIGHSMGGLLLRYALGVRYNPVTGRIAGLEPCHFVTLATPHLGCDSDGLSQVPFIGWLGVAPPLQWALRAASVPVGSLLFRRTGQQFFMADADAGRRHGTPGLPLLARMTHDVPERGEYFLSALIAFASRTAYANTGQDHLVGWANSSLRFVHQLPTLPPTASQAKGVVLEDALLAAFDTRFKPQVEPQSALSSLDLPVSRKSSRTQPDSAAPPASAPAPALASARSALGETVRSPRPGTSPSHHSPPGSPRQAAAPVRPLSSVTGAGVGAGAGGEITASQSAAQPGALALDSTRGRMVEGMLQRLQSLAWRRIDVCFKGATLPFAHNHIQVTRRWLNFEGESVAVHLADQMAALERTWAQLVAGDTLGHLERRSLTMEQTQRANEPLPGGAQVASREAIEASVRGSSAGSQPGSPRGAAQGDAQRSSVTWLDAVDDQGQFISDEGMHGKGSAHPVITAAPAPARE